MALFKSAIAPTVPERVERPPEAVMPLRVGIVYPLLLSTVWGIGIAALVVLLLLMAEQVWAFRLPAKLYLLIWLIVLVVVTLVAWSRYVPQAMWLVEEMYRVDLNRDGHVGEPPAERHTYEVKLDSNRMVMLDGLEMPERELADIARAVLAGTKNLSVNSLRHPDAAQLIEQMIERGLAYPRKHPKQPAQLTHGGRAWFEELKGREG